MLERRRRIRRALCGGVVLGAAAALPLALVEVVYVLVFAGAGFAGGADHARFALYAILLLVLAGTLFGAALGAIDGIGGLAAGWLGRRRNSAAEWMARLYAAAATHRYAPLFALEFAG